MNSRWRHLEKKFNGNVEVSWSLVFLFVGWVFDILINKRTNKKATSADRFTNKPGNPGTVVCTPFRSSFCAGRGKVGGCLEGRAQSCFLQFSKESPWAGIFTEIYNFLFNLKWKKKLWTLLCQSRYTGNVICCFVVFSELGKHDLKVSKHGYSILNIHQN